MKLKLRMLGKICSGLLFVKAATAALGQTAECLPTGDSDALYITPNCVDPSFSPIILSETDETLPVPHHKVSGHFNGSDVTFRIYLPPKTQWKGRFFQLVYPFQDPEAEDYTIAFGAESGGYTVHVSGTVGYRADAAAAKFSREVAQKHYGKKTSDHIYGYVYGGSGGSYQTIGAAEQTEGVWDGCVALVQAVPMSIPYNWGVRALAALVLDAARDNLITSVQPGSKTNPYSVVGELEMNILHEASALGVPLRAWEDWESTAENRTQLYQTLKDVAVPAIQGVDPTYADDFWTKEGYAGADRSELGERFRAALFEFNGMVQSVIKGSNGVVTKFELGNPLSEIVSRPGLGFTISVNGTHKPFNGELDSSTGTVYLRQGLPSDISQALVRGAEVQIDNRWYLATHTYHRHQLPPKEGWFYGFDSLRDAAGTPLYPQRDILLGPGIAAGSTGGATHTGNITMKMLLMDTLLDADAFPWHADWYKNQVQRAKGKLDNHFRLYYSDNANHEMHRLSAPTTGHAVEFIGLYEQHLQDLSAWVERGVKPPAATSYKVNNAQISVPATASKRGGIQPVAGLTVKGSTRFSGRVGDKVTFAITAEAPKGAGKIISLEWDPVGEGKFTKLDVKVGRKVSTKISHRYSVSGEYFPVVRVGSHKQGRTDTNIAVALNLGRARAVIRE